MRYGNSYDTLNAQTLRQIQNERLQQFIMRVVAPHSPHYSKLFAVQHIDPRTIKSVADLKAIPFTQKSDLLPTDADSQKFLQFMLKPDAEKLKRKPGVIARA